jgi:hypothetical protein
VQIMSFFWMSTLFADIIYPPSIGSPIWQMIFKFD